MTSRANTHDADQRAVLPLVEACDSDRVRHDIHASLAVINGYTQLLDSSFAQLCDTYQLLRDGDAVILQEDKTKHLLELESDCQSYLYRVQRCVEQLGAQLAAQELLIQNAEHGNCQDVA